jgi:hypothetical protein
MISFIIGCIGLAICIMIGFFFLNVIFFVLCMICAGIGALWSFLTGKND